MKASKKILAFVLAVTLIVTSGLSTVFAASNALLDSNVDSNPTDSTESTYTIIIDKNDYGTATASHSSAKKGTAVTVTAKPNAGMKLKSMTLFNASIADNTGKPITVNGNVGTFTMPENNVRVGITYEANPAESKKLTLTGLENAATIKYQVGSESWDITPVASKDFDVMGGTAVKLTITPKDGFMIKSATPTGFKFTTAANGVYAFTMPNADAKVEFMIVERPNATINDGEYMIPSGTTSNGVAVKEIVSAEAEEEDIAAIEEKAKTLVNEDKNAPKFPTIDLTPRDASGKLLTGKLNKPVKITLTLGNMGDFKPSVSNMRILHMHEGVVKVIRLSSVSGNDISFYMDEFSAIMPIAVTTTGGGITSGSSSGGGSYGGGGSSTYREFDGEKLYLVGGEIVPVSVVEEMAGKDKTFTVVYNGKAYTFNGKNIAKPGKHIMYYTPEEFMKLINAKAVGATVSNISNPDTGANDFMGLALALAVVSLAGVATCSISKKK